MIERRVKSALRAHSGAAKSKESAGKREAAHARGSTHSTGVSFNAEARLHDAVMLGHAVPAEGQKGAKSMCYH